MKYRILNPFIINYRFLMIFIKANRKKMLNAVHNLSMVYLMVIGERIDALSFSNLLCAWNEVGLL